MKQGSARMIAFSENDIQFSIVEGDRHRLLSPGEELSLEVKEIDANHQNLTLIPKEVFALNEVKVLALNHNKIRKLDPDISRLPGLEKLALNHNQLTRISPVIKK